MQTFVRTKLAISSLMRAEPGCLCASPPKSVTKLRYAPSPMPRWAVLDYLHALAETVLTLLQKLNAMQCPQFLNKLLSPGSPGPPARLRFLVKAAGPWCTPSALRLRPL